MNITFNGQTPENKGCWLATRPVLTHSEIQSDAITVPMRDGTLYGPSYRGMAIWNMTFHLKDDELDKKKRIVRQWLNEGNKSIGTLIMSDTPDSFYEVHRVNLLDDFRKSMEYGRISAKFICYPYEFLADGNTGLSGSQTIANTHDESCPLYKIVGNGTGVLSVGGSGMSFTVATADYGLYIDTRKFIAYNNAGTNRNGVLSGDYEDIRLKHGNNNVSLTMGTGSATLTTYPRWGYEI